MNQINTTPTSDSCQAVPGCFAHQKQPPYSSSSNSLLRLVFLISFLLWLSASTLSAQDLNDNGLPHRIDDVDYVDYTIPEGIQGELHFTLNGGDGGKRVVPNLCKFKGGRGATIDLAFNIGTETGELAPGGTIRFIIGKKGGNRGGNGAIGAGGGGGTGLLYTKANDISALPNLPSTVFGNAGSRWVILGVAGGGAGAFGNGVCSGYNGDGGRGSTPNNASAGEDNGGGSYRYDAPSSSNGGKKGGIDGGNGGSPLGGFGYGGGGGSGDLFNDAQGGGGGGGYAGGDGGGRGGYSFVSGRAISSNRESGGKTFSPRSGYIDYQFKDVVVTRPVPLCQDVVAELDADGTATVTIDDVNDGSYHPLGENFDMCFFVLAPPFFVGCGGDFDTYDCSELGYDQTLLLATYEPQPDGTLANLDACFATVTVEDNLPPTARCRQSLTVIPGPSGEVTISPAALNNGSFDNCGIASLTLDQSTFTCDDIGTHTVTLYAADASDNFSNCTTTVEVVEKIVDCPEDYCVEIPPGANSVYLDFSTPPVTAACGVQVSSRICRTDGIGLQCTPSSGFNTNDKSGFYEAGEYAILWRSRSNGSFTLDCINRIKVAPSEQDFVFTCEPSVTVPNLAEACELYVGIPNLPIVPPCGDYTFESKMCLMSSCEPATGYTTENLSGTYPTGDYQLTWRLLQNGVPQGQCVTQILLEPDPSIEAACSDATVDLGASGNASISVADINATPDDPCGNQSFTISQQDFGCQDVGNNIVTLTLIDPEGNTSSCTATVTVTEGNCTVLPLDLLMFTGELQGKHNVLKWTTANEENFSHFVIERSVDGASWQNLGQVTGAAAANPDLTAGAGQGQITGEYSYTDANPLSSSYYRLRMIDLDGTFAFSELVHLQRPDTMTSITVYPNPNNGRFVVDLPLVDGENATITLHDLTGRQLLRTTVSEQRYEQTTELPAGIYLLTAELISGPVTRRVVVRQ